MLNLREHVHLQDQDHEVLRAQALLLEGDVQHLRELANTVQVIVQEQCDKSKAWKIEYSNLSEFANNLIWDIPRMHRRARSMTHYDNTPQEDLEFIKLCD